MKIDIEFKEVTPIGDVLMDFKTMDGGELRIKMSSPRGHTVRMYMDSDSVNFLVDHLQMHLKAENK
jgi:3-keto-L-gulonate-6-phosphate decarboxylase